MMDKDFSHIPQFDVWDTEFQECRLRAKNQPELKLGLVLYQCKQ